MMDKALFIKYIAESLGVTPEVGIIKQKGSLPLHLRNNYKLATMVLYNHTVLLAQMTSLDFTPLSICKHINLLSMHFGLDTVLVLDTIDSFLRKKLVENKISFIVPGTQIYLPLLMIDLREVYTKNRELREKVSPSTQFTILHKIINSLSSPFTPKETGIVLGYTKMTMSRVIDELESLSICRVEERGKNRFAWFECDGRELWERVSRRLRSPIKRKIYVAMQVKELPYKKAGISALAERTLIAADDLPVYAVSKEQLSELLQRNDIKTVEYKHRADVELELWHYDPAMLSNNRIVDDLSLYLSLRDDEDERIQLGLKELMENFKWR